MDGAGPRRDNLETELARAKRKGNSRRIAELEAELAMPPFPMAVGYLWRTYFRIRRRMGGGFDRPNPIGWPDIESFVRMSGVRLAPWEVETIEGIDDAFVDSSVASKKKSPPATDKGVVESVPISDGHGVKSLLRSIGRRRGDNKKGGRSNG